jgi:hypothetical protein
MTDRPAPIFVSVKDAATMLGLTPGGAYELVDQQRIESRYCGRRRLVVVESLIEYAANLPSTPVVA